MHQSQNEFTRIFDLTLPSHFNGKQKIIATSEECEKIVKRMGIASLSELSSEFSFSSNDEMSRFEITGRIYANLTQNCIVTGLPVEEEINEPLHIKVRLGEEEDLPDESLMDPEDIEYTKNAKVDVGELVVQYLSLAINPYPRKEGVETIRGDQEPKKNPFAKLETLKKK